MSLQGSGTTRRQFIGTMAALSVAPTWSPASAAEEWPQRPVTFVVGFSAGGNIDVVGRLMAQRLSEKFGVQFIVENRVGGMGTVGALGVLKSPPDGYQLFWAGTGTISIFPAMGKPPYDTEKDFTPVSILGNSPQVLVINPKIPAKTVQEFVAYVKAQPNQMSYAGGGGPGSASNLMMALFLKRAGINMTAVSYRGTSMAVNDLIGGHIPAMFLPLPEALPQAAEGKLRMLGISSAKRAEQAPDLPSIAESGYPGYDIMSWVGLMVPSATPKPIIDKLAVEFQLAAKDPEFVKQLDKYGLGALGLTPDESVKFLDADRKLWTEAVELAGVSLK